MEWQSVPSATATRSSVEPVGGEQIADRHRVLVRFPVRVVTEGGWRRRFRDN